MALTDDEVKALEAKAEAVRETPVPRRVLSNATGAPATGRDARKWI